MILLTALIFILSEAIAEGLVKRNYPAVSDILFKWWVQILTAGALFLIWLLLAVKIDEYYPVIKLIIGYILFRYALFDVIFNVSAGLGINYIGSKKTYDKILSWIRDMWGIGTIWFTRAIALFWAISWLIGYKQ
ncbi:MAG: hypothetical protein RBU26_14190 [Sphaerochaeta sp.]|jgi:hypothetical protein|uniref:hypothetical protein n=1 Tax=Sphaerochaeta sp. TaxID=1972642 RepID=UPI002A35B535|nr:hypothetical protein [Sphaerochaeta sp.]MDX9826071.1 hypothetical protein [Sphaerochaeta sp.]